MIMLCIVEVKGKNRLVSSQNRKVLLPINQVVESIHLLSPSTAYD